MNKKSIIVLASVALLAMPLVSLAGFNPGAVPSSLNYNLNQLIDLIFSIVWPLFLAAAVIMFVVAALKFFAAQGDPGETNTARMFVIWGVVGMVVALLAWSIPLIMRNVVGV